MTNLMEVCFTGHRKLPNGYDPDPRVEAAAQSVLEELRQQDEHIIAYNGLAVGFDQMMAWLCLRMDIPVIGCVPFRGQHKAWPAATQKQYMELCHSIKNSGGKLILVHDGPYYTQVMQKRNEYMVEHSTLIITCWSGSPGGTANCVNYAKSCNKTVINIWKEAFGK